MHILKLLTFNTYKFNETLILTMRNYNFILLISVFLFISCSTTKSVEDKLYKISFTKERIIDEDLFYTKNMNTAREMADHNLKNLKKIEYYSLFTNDKESMYKREVGLNSNSIVSTASGTVQTTEYETYLYRKLSEQEYLMSVNGENYVIKDSLKVIDWKIDNNSVKNILGYQVIKAESKGLEKDSKLIAWFTKELPYNAGPYLYSGLPGLILEVEVVFLNDDSPMSYIKGSITKANTIDLIYHKDISVKTKNKRILTEKERELEIQEYNRKLRENSQGVDKD